MNNPMNISKDEIVTNMSHDMTNKDDEINLINIEKVLREMKPGMNEAGMKLLVKFLKRFLREDDLNDIIIRNQHLRGFLFLNQALDDFNFSYQVSNKSLQRIPAEGRVIIVANHPIGSLDGLAILKLVRSVRPDVRIVANYLLHQVEPLRSLFLTVDNMSKNAKHGRAYQAMIDALNNEEALIIFPAGEVSRIRPNGVRDGKWKVGFLNVAKKTQSPILPIFIDARNSALFYGVSTVFKPLSMMMLAQELFKQENEEIIFKVGNSVPWSSVKDFEGGFKKLAKRFRKQVYRLDKKKIKKPLFETVETVAHPVNRKELKDALNKADLLGETNDGKKIFLYDYEPDSPIIHEIGRLRELTFRSVEEGTGKSLDFDKYDNYYRHLVLWDDNDLEIVGSYRIGEGKSIMKKYGIEGFYTNTLFELKNEFEQYLPDSIEMGRTFIQPRYWGLRGLDYLWYGIGAYINSRPEIKYMFGPLSLSNSYPAEAKQLIISFYNQQFGSKKELAHAKQPFLLTKESREFAAKEFSGDYRECFKTLAGELNKLDLRIPTLFKQYTDLCEADGCHFIDFSVDPAFNNCIDGLIFVEIEKIKDRKRKRYISKRVNSAKNITAEAVE